MRIITTLALAILSLSTAAVADIEVNLTNFSVEHKYDKIEDNRYAIISLETKTKTTILKEKYLFGSTKSADNFDVGNITAILKTENSSDKKKASRTFNLFGQRGAKELKDDANIYSATEIMHTFLIDNKERVKVKGAITAKMDIDGGVTISMTYMFIEPDKIMEVFKKAKNTVEFKFANCHVTVSGLALYAMNELANLRVPDTKHKLKPAPKKPAAPKKTSSQHASILKALWQIESSSSYTAPRGAAGEIGPYQIGRAYWKDAQVSGTWADCESKTYSETVISRYMARYCPTAWSTGDWETVARIHNGGPNGHHKDSTKPYWTKVKAQL